MSLRLRLLILIKVDLLFVLELLDVLLNNLNCSSCMHLDSLRTRGVLLDLLKSKQDRLRYNVRRELAARESTDVLKATDAWLKGLDKDGEDYLHNVLEGLWIYQTQNVVNEDLLKQLLSCDDHNARSAAVRVLSFWIDDVDSALDLLKTAVGDEHPRVRLEAVRALSFVEPSDDAIETALGVLEQDVDDYLQYTLDETMRVLEQ